MIRIVTILGAVGGVGATTVAAHLTSALARYGQSVLGIDLCPDNRLRLHFGMALSDHSGWARMVVESRTWYDGAFRSSDGIDFVPFGELDDEMQLDCLLDHLQRHPWWLRDELLQLRFAGETIVVCDCPRLLPVICRQIVPISDLVLTVTSSDTASYAAATKFVRNAANRKGPENAIVLNAYDSRRQLDQDIALLLRTHYRRELLRPLVHSDEAIRESLACKQTAISFASASQAAHDMMSLVPEVLARLDRQSGMAS